jgi:hypothetical protein
LDAKASTKPQSSDLSQMMHVNEDNEQTLGVTNQCQLLIAWRTLSIKTRNLPVLNPAPSRKRFSITCRSDMDISECPLH